MRRAISPIIAAVLLVIIAVAAGVMIWTWISGYAQQNPTEQPVLKERIRIDAVNIDYEDNNVTVRAYVRNIGDIDTEVASMYLLNATTGTAICQVNISVTQDRSVAIGGVTEIFGFCNNTANIIKGKPIIVKVVTIRGVEAVFQTIAPLR